MIDAFRDIAKGSWVGRLEYWRGSFYATQDSMSLLLGPAELAKDSGIVASFLLHCVHVDAFFTLRT